MTIYDRIKELRLKKGISQLDLAISVGYKGRSAISKVENGERDISQSMIEKYAKALGVTPTYLLYGEDTKNIPVANTDNGRVNEFINLFSQLSSEQQSLIVSQIKGILSNQ